MHQSLSQWSQRDLFIGFCPYYYGIYLVDIPELQHIFNWLHLVFYTHIIYGFHLIEYMVFNIRILKH